MKIYLFIVLIVLSSAFSQKATDWQIIVDQDDLKVYRGTKQKNNIYPIRGDFYTSFTPDRIVAIFSDIATKPQWLPKLTKTKLLKKYSSKKWIEYAEINVPWPCKNRDLVFELQVDINEDFSKVVYHLKSVQNDVVYNKNNIRALVYNSKMVITYDKETKKSFIQSESFVDPRGAIPRWIVNLFQKRQTIQIAKALVKRLEERLYANIPADALRSGPL